MSDGTEYSLGSARFARRDQLPLHPGSLPPATEPGAQRDLSRGLDHGPSWVGHSDSQSLRAQRPLPLPGHRTFHRGHGQDDGVSLGQSLQGGRQVHDWPGTLWEGPYHCQIVDDDEATQVERLEYLLAQSCAAGLTSKPGEWPGIHSVEALLDGRPLVGKWISRRSQWAARNRKGADSSDEAHGENLELKLDPLPCWEGFPEEDRRERVAEILTRIEETTRARHAADGTEPAARRKILEIDPHHRPEEAKSSPEPIVLARDPARRKRLRQAVSAVVAAFRDAAEKLAEGILRVRFPRGTFPPGLPYVPTVSDLLAGG